MITLQCSGAMARPLSNASGEEGGYLSLLLKISWWSLVEHSNVPPTKDSHEECRDVRGSLPLNQMTQMHLCYPFRVGGQSWGTLLSSIIIFSMINTDHDSFPPLQHWTEVWLCRSHGGVHTSGGTLLISPSRGPLHWGPLCGVCRH
jgi:hypothetical protein